MAYNNFTLADVTDRFELNLAGFPFCENLPVAIPSELFSAILSEWLAHAGLSLETECSFGMDNVIVNEQKGVWRNIETGNVSSEAVVASHYRVTAGKVSYVARYDSLKIALEKAGLDESHELHR